MLKRLFVLVICGTTLASLGACVVTPVGRPGYVHDRDADGVPNRYDRDRDNDGVRNRNDDRPNNPYRR